ncbi:winged helix-turn-helix domain-containing protein [Pseudarthrobacter sp. L1SW]|uniref:helix-turn-helix transcriptional regulator n=1 Tax=Pseudarthrobacter sp. L1SW TaxID=2851598 RepID=UPI001E2E02D6|nr:winged helix-turn-helix domain-containing protein [Pseudarthrobacter sp. L1SW]UEL27765.1 winged helix-turn-helix domain-containing protein [Pseudarthrobacter sp. L1SW]
MAEPSAIVQGVASEDFEAKGNDTAGSGTRWTFLTNHAHVLLTIARDPQVRLRELAATVGITERAAQKIAADLAEAGYITRTRQGRRNIYSVVSGRPFRHPIDSGHQLDELLAVLVPERGLPAEGTQA